MKVCFVTHLGDLSGANKSLVDLVQVLRKKEIEIIVVVPKKGELSRKLTELGISVKSIYSGCWVGDPKKETVFKKIVKKCVNFVAEYRFYRFFKKNINTIDIVHYNSMVYGVGSKSLSLLKIPYVWHIREFPEDTFGLSFYNKSKSYDLISNSQVIFAISKSIYNKFSKEFKKGNVTLVYNGINIENNSLKQQKNNTLHPSGKVSLLLVGAISPDKGQYEAIQAIKKLVSNGYNITLQLVGKVVDEEYYNSLIRYINENDMRDNIVFHGYHTDLTHFRRNSSIALVCSKMEAFGRVTVEAMLSRQLVIGANTGGTAEIINDNETGLLYTQGEVDSLVTKISYAINHAAEMNNITNNAYEAAKEFFTIERTAEEVIEQYNLIRRIS